MQTRSVKSEQQDEAEAEVEGFRANLGPFVVAAETTRMAMVFTDAAPPENPIIFANDSFLKLTGYGREEVLGKPFNFLMAQAADAEAIAQIQSEFNGQSGNGSEIRYRRKDGSEFWAGVFISPVRDEAGQIVQYFASFVDLTRHREKEAQSKMLIDELNHRVKNTLATVQAIVSQALRSSSDRAVTRDAIESRLSALSRSHDLLSRENWASAGLSDIVHDALEPFIVTVGRVERCVIVGDNVRFSPKSALALGIAFNELATNAMKYGAFSNEGGSIRVTWHAHPGAHGKRLIIRWEEKDGPPVDPPARKGFGTRVLEQGLAHELEGTVSLNYLSTGLVCTIDIPAP